MDAGLLALLFASVRLATPLAIAAMGELVAERAGFLDIATENTALNGGSH